MVSLHRIDALHARLGRADALGDHLAALAEIDVTRFESLVVDGHTRFDGADGTSISTPATHETLAVSEAVDRESALDHLRRHAAGETSYVEMSRGLAAAGVASWVADTGSRTMTYVGSDGSTVLVERVD